MSLEEKIKEIEKRIFDHQAENGFDTIFDLILEDLAGLKADQPKDTIPIEDLGFKVLLKDEVEEMRSPSKDYLFSEGKPKCLCNNAGEYENCDIDCEGREEEPEPKKVITKEQILSAMKEVMPFRYSPNQEPYILEAMEIYRNQANQYLKKAENYTYPLIEEIQGSVTDEEQKAVEDRMDEETKEQGLGEVSRKILDFWESEETDPNYFPLLMLELEKALK